jgi:uncharacterized protein (UPF0212 family)
MRRLFNQSRAVAVVEVGKVYCPMCTHTVDAEIEHQVRRSFARPGQKCPRCLAPLDAGYILPMSRAA